MKTACVYGLAVGLMISIGLAVEGAVGLERFGQWRGEGGQGHSTAKNLPAKFSETEGVTWKRTIPGKGWSSPVVEGNEIWMTTAFDVPAKAGDKKERLKENTGSQPLVVSEKVIFHAVCVDRRSGKLLHNVKLFEKKSPQWVHELNSYASPSPVLRNGKLYCHFGSYGTACLDTKTRKVMWVNQEIRVMHENGPGSTPVLVDGRLIFHCDGSDKQFVAALDAKTGKRLWKTKRSGKMNANPQLKKAYGTPIVLEVDGKKQIISTGANWLYSYDAKTGEELWKVEYGGLGFSNVPRPVAGHEMIYISTSFMRAQMLAVKYKGLNGKKPHIVWRYKKQVPRMSSPLLVGDELYFVADSGGRVTCLDAHTGKVHYVERIGGNFSSSPMYADGKIFFSSREGVVTVLKPGKKFKVIAKNELDGSLMASPAALGDALFLRTDKALYRIEK